MERDELNERINMRVEGMVANGLVNEVRRLRDAYGCDTEAMTGIGYRQICRWLDSAMGAEEQGSRRPERSEDDGMFRSRGPMAGGSLADAVEETKKATRAYAKRQMTWFKRDDRIQWIRSSEEAFGLVTRFLT